MPWDGTLSCEDTLPATALTAPAVTVAALQGTAELAPQAPAALPLTAALGTLALTPPTIKPGVLLDVGPTFAE